ncbi:DENN domain-containing protein 2C [Kryptolebias marmoratus]|uniref:DENN/MADD domain containing 2C n=1 Tax=Kryptolebias marmoratus TaxID=37003 RepID=A0A3Q2ZU92_KRYMA|nr:DENN domain-containing protein 2C [Kryptolebias marmoratus]XP_017266882.1 DENN domain-containing protein 2C [Kryptolebias marmoratus]XP_017266883.1 DENN domain-containing protein 2C [Kryptolebias marmoratus]XP_037833089.1 DENN domain-containing protein 2C [Kryptolebias marmoratus]
MLALRVEQGGRGLDEVERLQKEAAAGWQGRQSGRPASHERRVNIKEKISQWEVRSQQGSSQDAGVKVHPPTVARTFSADLLGSGSRTEFCGKENHSRTKSVELDFRESPAHVELSVVGRKSEPLQKCSTPFSTASPGKQTLAAQTFASSKVESNDTLANGHPKVEWISDAEKVSKPLPPSADDQDYNMPAGNFYTSRGFWRKLEGDRLLWENSRSPAGEALPPPKPQRTFEYRGSNDGSTGSTARTAQWDVRPTYNNNRSKTRSRRVAHPPSFPPPPCPVSKSEGLSRHKKNRKSFEYEDAARLTAQPGDGGNEDTLQHAYSDDNIYEDIVCDISRNDPYEDVKLSTTCLPPLRSRVPKTMHGNKVEKKTFQALPGFKSSTFANTPKPVAPRRTSTQKTQKTPRFVSKIETIFDEKRGRKRVKNQGLSARAEETSGTESDPEDNTKGSRRSVYIQSTLRRRSEYRTLERDLIQLQQQQQQLFQIFVVVSLRKGSPGNAYSPEITQQFPKMFEKSSRVSKEAEDQLKVIPKFCFPDCQDWKPSAQMPSETFSFVLTGEDGSRWFCYCRKILPSGKGKRLPEVHCIVSKLGCFDLFAKILEEVERRREMSPALVYPFMRSVMEAPFPAPGRTVTVKSFLPGSGNEVLTLCRPVDSRLEHVDFNSLLQCLSVGKLLQVFASLLLERRVIFVADKLSVLSRCGHAVLALLYPFTWQHTFVPVLPANMLDICCSPTPFLIGVLAPCLPQVLELPIEEVLIVDLCADTFVVQLGDEDCILPSKLQAALQQILEDRDGILRQDGGDGGDQQVELSSLVSEAFVRFFVELVGHYPLHMVESFNGTKELQRDSFRKSHPSRGVRQFLQLFMDTQMFAGFIQDKELRKGGGKKGLFESRVVEYLESSPEPEPSGVNKFLKGLGSKMKLLQIK